MKRYIYIIIGLFLLLGFLLIYLNTTKFPSDEGNYYVYIAELDSVTTERHLDHIIDGWYIDEEDPFKHLKRRRDLRYLPYFVQMYSDCYLTKVRARYTQVPFAKVSTKYDLTLFNLFEHLAGNDSKKNGQTDVEGFEADYEFDSAAPYSNYEYIENEFISVDSLRVRAVAHNDRSALEKLESYYTHRNEIKELAIYYKVMLSYEGNGDLAEKFYYVLRPYMDDEHRYYNGIRTVLLRAALCDHNARAQELCDSLGFSLCDYRLPLLDE